jgi:hypothetical protein
MDEKKSKNRQDGDNRSVRNGDTEDEEEDEEEDDGRDGELDDDMYEDQGNGATIYTLNHSPLNGHDLAANKGATNCNPRTAKTALEERLRIHQLYDYSVQNWGHHVREILVMCQEVEHFLSCEKQLEASNQARLAIKRYS